MTKAQIHFSNHLESLLNPFKEQLFPHGADLFEKRLVVVPHLSMKSYLMHALALDPEFEVAAGLKILNVKGAWESITKKRWPTPLELSLYLQYKLLPMIEQHTELESYFDKESKEQRIGPFCDVLASHFLRYAIYGKRPLPSWQERLWQSLDFSGIPSGKWHIHLFGFSHLPQFYFSFFEKLDAKFYFFSPCQIFWGDFYNEQEKKQLDQLDFLEGQNPFLTNWGRVGRKMFLFVEEKTIPTVEHYEVNGSHTALHRFQQGVLDGQPVDHGTDESIYAFSAVDRMHEVEILRKKILGFFEEGVQPKEIVVFAPEIHLYAPFIEAIFSDIPHSVHDLKYDEVDEVARAFRKLIELPKKRFSSEEVLQFLAASRKFPFHFPLISKWIDQANIRWGISKKQRKQFFLEGAEEEMIHVNEEAGTWDAGLRRLLVGLGELEDLSIVQITEVEQLGKLISVIASLEEDLAPFYDKTKWTIPTWLRYFACLMESYLTFEPDHELYKELLELANRCDPLDQEEVPFPGVERVLESLLSKTGKTHQAPHLQAIRFASLAEGSVLPAQVIALLGMQEEAFPRVEVGNSLDMGEIEYRPKQGEIDRYLFLQTVLFARKALLISYVRDSTSHFGSSSLMTELCLLHHLPKSPPYPKKSQEPLIPSFYTSVMLEEVLVKDPIEIDIQKLFKFARHPLRFYLHEVLGIVPEYETKENASEFVLQPLTKHFLMKEAFQKPLDEVLENARLRGDLPINLLMPMAKAQIEEELALYPTFPEEIEIEPIQIGPITLTGKLDNFSRDGLLVKGKNSLSDHIAFWPQGLIAKRLGLPLFFLKDGTTAIMEGSLEAYIRYFLLAQKTPSPLVPSLAKAFLEGTFVDVKTGLKQCDDEIFRYLEMRDPPFHPEVIHANWSHYLQTLFGRIDAEV